MFILTAPHFLMFCKPIFLPCTEFIYLSKMVISYISSHRQCIYCAVSYGTKRFNDLVRWKRLRISEDVVVLATTDARIMAHATQEMYYIHEDLYDPNEQINGVLTRLNPLIRPDNIDQHLPFEPIAAQSINYGRLNDHGKIEEIRRFFQIEVVHHNGN